MATDTTAARLSRPASLERRDHLAQPARGHGQEHVVGARHPGGGRLDPQLRRQLDAGQVHAVLALRLQPRRLLGGARLQRRAQPAPRQQHGQRRPERPRPDHRRALGSRRRQRARARASARLAGCGPADLGDPVSPSARAREPRARGRACASSAHLIREPSRAPAPPLSARVVAACRMTCRSRMRASNGVQRVLAGHRIGRHARLTRARGDLECRAATQRASVRRRSRQHHRAGAAHARVEVERVERRARRSGTRPARAARPHASRAGRGPAPAGPPATRPRPIARATSLRAQRSANGPATTSTVRGITIGHPFRPWPPTRAHREAGARRSDRDDRLRSRAARQQSRASCSFPSAGSRSSTSSTTTSSASRRSCATCASARR